MSEPITFAVMPKADVRHLRYFVAVAEERHFGRAAARLHVTTPPLSQRIRELEEDLGVRLFERTSRRVELTPAGERLLVEARDVLPPRWSDSTRSAPSSPPPRPPRCESATATAARAA